LFLFQNETGHDYRNILPKKWSEKYLIKIECWNNSRHLCQDFSQEWYIWSISRV